MSDTLDISLKDWQELMRHADVRLSMPRYTRAKLHDLGAAVEKLPPIGPTSPRTEPATLRATGTDCGGRSDAVPDAVAGGNGRLRLRTTEEEDGSSDHDNPGRPGSEKPPVSQGFESGQEPLRTIKSGEGGIL